MSGCWKAVATTRARGAAQDSLQSDCGASLEVFDAGVVHGVFFIPGLELLSRSCHRVVSSLGGNEYRGALNAAQHKRVQPFQAYTYQRLIT